jgi:hypothetical protein
MKLALVLVLACFSFLFVPVLVLTHCSEHRPILHERVCTLGLG